VVLNYCVPPEYDEQALEHLQVGARRTGRSVDQIERFQLVVCSVNEDRQGALECSRQLLTQYLAQQPHIAEASGVSKDVVAEIQSILGWPATLAQIQRAKHLVSDELVQRITASGTPAEARAKVDEYRRRGATCPILYDVCGNPQLLVETFGSPA
jgi:5,10-methylenetetrahydromethanopterin reductase